MNYALFCLNIRVYFRFSDREFPELFDLEVAHRREPGEQVVLP